MAASVVGPFAGNAGSVFYARSMFRLRRSARRRIGLNLAEPVSTQFGLDRGRPVDRFYIERFLEQNRQLIRGRVLEVQERTYTDWYGTGVEQSDVLHAGPGNPEATLVGDLTTGEGIPQDAFDCIILTQTLPFIWDVRAAVHGTRTALRPGGTLLATVPGISQISREDMREWGDWWRFTSASAKRLFDEEYGAGNVQTETHGNLVAACAFLYGLAAEELAPEELERRQEDYEMITTIRARRAT
jgi:SAM-dependent methyltransferase